MPISILFPFLNIRYPIVSCKSQMLSFIENKSVRSFDTYNRKRPNTVSSAFGRFSFHYKVSIYEFTIESNLSLPATRTQADSPYYEFRT